MKGIFTRILLAAGGLLLVIGLFALPKDVVEDDSSAFSDEANNSTSSANELINTNNYSKEDLEKINLVRKAYLSASDTEKKSKFADSLVHLYSDFLMIDSIAAFIEEIAVNEPSYENWERTGNAYFTAFNMTDNDQLKKINGRKAKEYYKKVLRTYPQRYDLKARQAVVMVYTDSPPMIGIRQLKEVTEQDPTLMEAWMYLGEHQMRVNKVDKAITSFRAVLKQDKNNVLALIHLGECYNNLGNTDKAREYFEKAKSVEGTDEYYRNYINNALKELKQL